MRAMHRKGAEFARISIAPRHPQKIDKRISGRASDACSHMKLFSLRLTAREDYTPRRYSNVWKRILKRGPVGMLSSTTILYWYRATPYRSTLHSCVHCCRCINNLSLDSLLMRAPIIEGVVQIGENWHIRGRTLTAYRRSTNPISRQAMKKTRSEERNQVPSGNLTFERCSLHRG